MSRHVDVEIPAGLRTLDILVHPVEEVKVRAETQIKNPLFVYAIHVLGEGEVTACCVVG